MKQAVATGATTVILDTAGRLNIDEMMMDEIKGIKARVQPIETLLVADAMTGQEAVRVATDFHQAVTLTGLIMTKVDGDARGGAAISMREVTARLIGEKTEFEGKRYPTFFKLQRGEETKNCHKGSRFRVQFETDAVNDYFGRDNDPGYFELRFNGQPSDDYVLNLWNGIATLNVSLPTNVASSSCRCRSSVAGSTRMPSCGRSCGRWRSTSA